MNRYSSPEEYLEQTENSESHQHRFMFVLPFWLCACGETMLSKSAILPEFTPPGALGDGVDEETHARFAPQGSFETRAPLEANEGVPQRFRKERRLPLVGELAPWERPS